MNRIRTLPHHLQHFGASKLFRFYCLYQALNFLIDFAT
jgi:hypothetical protein